MSARAPQASEQAEEEIANVIPRRQGNQITALWNLRVGTVLIAAWSEVSQDFPAHSAKYIGARSIRQAKEGYCSLVSENNLGGGDQGSILVVQVRDEACMRMRLVAAELAATDYILRARSSKIQNQDIRLVVRSLEAPFYTELVALVRKGAATIAASLSQSLADFVNVLAPDLESSSPFRLVHLPVGDGMTTICSCEASFRQNGANAAPSPVQPHSVSLQRHLCGAVAAAAGANPHLLARGSTSTFLRTAPKSSACRFEIFFPGT